MTISSKHSNAPGATEDRDVPTISPIIGEGVDAHRLVRVGEWTFTEWEAVGDGELRMRDVDGGERLGIGRARDIRKLIKRTWPGEKLKEIHQRATVARCSGQVAARITVEYWPTESQWLKLIARSETEIADAILDDMIRVYMLARRGLLGNHMPSTPEGMAMAVGRIVGHEMTNALAPIVRRMVEIENRAIERHEAERKAMDAVLARVAKLEEQPVAPGADMAFAREVCAGLRRYAVLMAGENDKAGAKCFRGKAETEIRRQLHHTGSGSAWCWLRGTTKKDETRRLIRNLLETAEAVAAARSPSQGDLFNNVTPIGDAKKKGGER